MPLLLSALGLMLVLEGIPYFAAPNRARRILLALAALPAGALRGVGLTAMLAGLGLLLITRAMS